MKVREPVARPLDVVAVELLLSASQAFLVGVLMYLAIGIWDDRGVGFGPVAMILALLGLAVGGSWLYWLFGGVGWPMAAADVPVAVFLGAALVLGWADDLVVRVEGVPLLLAVASAVYGIVGGVFIDSPRRWRWDQRQKLRPGTPVPRVSPTTRALMAQVPRSLPRRSAPPSADDLASRIEASSPGGGPPSGNVGTPYIADEEMPDDTASPGVEVGMEVEVAAETTREPSEPMAERAGMEATMPTERLERGARSDRAEPVEPEVEEGGPIELPTSVEPKAQRSPWAWAAPPEWNRDEDDEQPAGGSSRRT